MENRKYEFTGERIEHYGRMLYRIRAVRDFESLNGVIIHAGELGGWIEKEDNLSHDGGCWVGDDAAVFDNARVYNNGVIVGDAVIYDDARVFNNAFVCDDVKVFNHAKIYGDAELYGDTIVRECAQVFDEVCIHGDVLVCGDAQVYGDTCVCASTFIGPGAIIRSDDDYCTIHGFGHENGSTTFFNTSREDGKYEIFVAYGRYRGKIEEFEANVRGEYADNGDELMLAIAMVKKRFEMRFRKK